MGSLRIPAIRVRMNPPDLEARLEALRRMAAPNSGASPNEREMAQSRADRLEADLRAKGWTPRVTPTAGPSYSSYSRAPAEDYGPVKTTNDFVNIPPEYLNLVKKDILPKAQGGKDFGFAVGGTYMFVRARDLGVTSENNFNWRRRGERDGYLLVSVPPPQLVRDDRSPIITGFYADEGRGPQSCGQFPEALDLESDGLYKRGFFGVGPKVFAIVPADVVKLNSMGAFYQVQ